ncbi:hypothetical protein G6F37_013407 [Rhizopus arrhizus]|nr:hypothetical protein G6F38_013297 [Rhizopus arrhizus]KAG1138080.1 hypothetical protein G6F37_013407 [Rhizopus arrhizus]
MNNASDDTNVIQMKPKRKRTSPEQFSLLSESFNKTDTPNYDLREKLAKQLDMTNREVQVWFQNRRAKVNRLRLQQQQQQKEQEKQQQQQQQEVKKPRFYYWSNKSSTSSSASSSPPQTPHDIILQPNLTPIDILATAAAYVQQWEDEQRTSERKKRWRPWL